MKGEVGSRLKAGKAHTYSTVGTESLIALHSAVDVINVKCDVILN